MNLFIFISLGFYLLYQATRECRKNVQLITEIEWSSVAVLLSKVHSYLFSNEKSFKTIRLSVKIGVF